MERKLVNAFAQTVMPEDCVKRIEGKLEEKKGSPCRYEETPMAESRWSWLAPVAAVLALVLAVGIILPWMQQTPKQLAEMPTEELQEGDVVEGRVWEFEGGAVTVTKGERYRQGGFSEGSYDTAYLPTWLVEQDGRLFFVPEGIKGDKVDITDLISMDEPYTHIYTDEDGIIHYISVGMLHEGPFVSIEESVGWGVWFRDKAEMEAGLAEGDVFAGWLTGYARGHWDNEADTDAGWYAKAIEIMDIPWGRA